MQTATVDKMQQKITDDKFQQEPIVLPPDSGEKLNIAGSPISHKVKSKDTNGVFSVMEFVTPPGKVSLFMFTNVGNKPSRLLDTILPGQFDNYFVELAGLFTRGEPSQEQNDALSRKYRIKYL